MKTDRLVNRYHDILCVVYTSSTHIVELLQEEHVLNDGFKNKMEMRIVFNSFFFHRACFSTCRFTVSPPSFPCL